VFDRCFWLSSGLSLSPAGAMGRPKGVGPNGPPLVAVAPSDIPRIPRLTCKIARCLKGRRCNVWNGKEDKKQKYFLPLPLLLLFCCYSYYYYHIHHHHNSVTTISFITMICSFVSPQIHYFLFFLFPPTTIRHPLQPNLLVYYETFRYTLSHIPLPKLDPILVMINAQWGHVLALPLTDLHKSRQPSRYKLIHVDGSRTPGHQLRT